MKLKNVVKSRGRVKERRTLGNIVRAVGVAEAAEFVADCG
jgi:hypothetical protein